MGYSLCWSFDYQKFSEILTTLRIKDTITIVQNNSREIWGTLDLSLVAIKGNLCHYYSALSVFSENIGHAQPIKITIIKKCPKLQRIYCSLYPEIKPANRTEHGLNIQSGSIQIL